MKNFKIIDFLLQIIFIVVGIVLVVFKNELRFEGIDLLTGYFLVGGWQVLSAIVHFFYPAPYRILLRKIYLYTLAGVIVIMLLSLLDDDILIGALEGLLFFSPLMALYYLVVCFLETKGLIDRDRAQ